MEQKELISAMLDDVLADSSADAQEKFNTLVSQRISDALDSKKAEIAATVYPKGTNEESV